MEVDRKLTGSKDHRKAWSTFISSALNSVLWAVIGNLSLGLFQFCYLDSTAFQIINEQNQWQEKKVYIGLILFRNGVKLDPIM